MSHLDEDSLFRFVLGQLPPAEGDAAQAHLAECEACRHRKDNLSSLVFASTLTPTPAPPGSTPGRPPTTKPDAPGSRALSPPVATQGASFGRYHLLERLGMGGMGEVYAAFDPQLDRRVALKLLRSGALSAAEGRARLVREAQSMARLQHPNVATVHDVGAVDEHVFVAMEFVEGETLGEWLRGERRWEDVIDVFLQAGAGLAAAHQAGLVHRDFKPDNVLIGKDGRPRVVDFGLARQSTSTPPATTRPGEVPEAEANSPLTTRLTRDGAVMGTPGYMAPEQLAGLPTDARSDQFSFCVALFEGLYGKRPFGGATLKQHAQEIAAGRLPEPPASSAVPSRLYQAVKRGLAADPAQRWPDMASLLAALRPRATTPRRRWMVVTVATVALVALWAAWTQQRLRACSGFEQRLVGVWDTATRQRLRSAMVETGLPWAATSWTAVERSLDAWTREWLDAEKATCEAGRLRQTDPEDVYEYKSACLEGRLQRLAAMTRLLATADREIAGNAPAAAHALEPASGCFDLTSMTRAGKVSAAEQAAETALRAALVEARALFDAGKYAAGVKRLEEALAAGGPARTRAEAGLWLGRLRFRAGEPKRASADFLAAATAALEAQDPALEAMAFSKLAGTTSGEKEGPGADAELFQGLARAAAVQVRDDWEVQTELANNEALAAMGRKQFKEALAGFQVVLAAQEAHLGPTHPSVAMTLNNLGVAWSNLGNYAEALARYERSLAVHRAQEGDEHPNTASAENNLASSLRRLGRYTSASAHYQKALEVRRKTLGPAHPETLKTAEAVAMVEAHAGRGEYALDLLETTLAEQRKVAGPGSREVANLYDDLADLYARGRFWRESQRYAELELETARQGSGEKGAAVAKAHLALAVALMNQGAWAQAGRSLEEALALRQERFGPDSHEVASVLNAQGDLLALQRQLPEALARYAQAREARSRAGPATPEMLSGDAARVGRALLEAGQAAEAVVQLTQARRLLEGVEDDPAKALADFDLARALEAGDASRREEARAMVAAARARLDPAERPRAEAWLATLATSPPDGGAP